jgi:hypothetical protein
VKEDSGEKERGCESHIVPQGRMDRSDAHDECRKLKDASHDGNMSESFVSPVDEEERIDGMVTPTTAEVDELAIVDAS